MALSGSVLISCRNLPVTVICIVKSCATGVSGYRTICCSVQLAGVPILIHLKDSDQMVICHFGFHIGIIETIICSLKTISGNILISGLPDGCIILIFFIDPGVLCICGMRLRICFRLVHFYFIIPSRFWFKTLVRPVLLYLYLRSFCKRAHFISNDTVCPGLKSLCLYRAIDLYIKGDVLHRFPAVILLGDADIIILFFGVRNLQIGGPDKVLPVGMSGIGILIYFVCAVRNPYIGLAIFGRNLIICVPSGIIGRDRQHDQLPISSSRRHIPGLRTKNRKGIRIIGTCCHHPVTLVVPVLGPSCVCIIIIRACSIDRRIGRSVCN